MRTGPKGFLVIIGRLAPEDRFELAKRVLLKAGYKPVLGFGKSDEDNAINFSKAQSEKGKIKLITLKPEQNLSMFFSNPSEAGLTLKSSTSIEGVFRWLPSTTNIGVEHGCVTDPTLCEGFEYPPSLRIEALFLHGYRGFLEANIRLSKTSSTIFIGNNGSGKSSILDALATSLSWLSKRIVNENSQGRKPAQDDIHNEKSSSTVFIGVSYYGRSTGWTVSEKRKGSPDRITSNFKPLSSIVKAQQWEYSSKHIPTNLPTLVYYPVNRAVLDVPKRIKKKHHFEPLETYEDALVAGGRDFRFFFEWFRERENLENEIIRDDKDFLDRELQAVRKAVRDFTGLEDLRIRRRPKQRMMAIKDGKELSVQQLSDGEKCLLALVGDLARRLALANPEMEDPLQGCGVVLIDEIELHLHPNWQRQIVRNLETTFPNCQFILTTHSPLVLSQVPRESIRILDNFEVIENTAHVEGREVNSILADVMGVPIFPDQTKKGLDKVEELVEKEDYAEARKLLEKLAEKLGELDPTIVHHRSTIDFLEEDLFED